MTLDRIQGGHHDPIAISMAASDLLESVHNSALGQIQVEQIWARSMPDPRQRSRGMLQVRGGRHGRVGRRGSADEVPACGNICSPKLAFCTPSPASWRPGRGKASAGQARLSSAASTNVPRPESHHGPLAFAESLSIQPQCSSPQASAAFASFRMALAQASCTFSYPKFGNRWSCATLLQSE